MSGFLSSATEAAVTLPRTDLINSGVEYLIATQRHITQHLPWLKPTAPNKMYNAQLVEVRSPGRWEEPTAYPTMRADLRHNTELWTPLLTSLAATAETFAGEGKRKDGTPVKRSFSAFAGLIDHAKLMNVIRDLSWNGASFAPHLEYLEEIGRSPAQVDDWLMLAPQHASGGHRLRIDDRQYSWFARDRRRAPLFGAISEPKHRPAPLRIAGAGRSIGDVTSDGYANDRRGVVVLYPIVEPEHREEIGQSGELDLGKIVMAFSFVAPATALGSDNRLVRFRAVDSGRANEAIISVK